jgi:hypothetical protein
MRLVGHLAAVVGALMVGGASVEAQSSTVFTYQGRLESLGAAVSGKADLKFRLYPQSAGGSMIGSEVTKEGVAIDAGVFATDLDFGDAAFLPGAARWLEIDVRSPSGSGAYTTIAPRTPINPTPLAQGLAGASITRAGPAAEDQNQYDAQFNGILPLRLDTDPIWQSFTANRSGALTAITLYGYGLVAGGGDQPITVRLRAGIGTGGAVLGTANATVRQGQGTPIQLTFANVSVVAGEKYTIDPTGPIFIMGAKSDIAGAQANPPQYRIVFKTFVAPEATIGLKASRAGLADTAKTVDWSGIANVPANVSNAFSPWAATVGGSRLTGGFAQIDTGVLLQFGGAAENGDPIALRRFNFANEQSGLEMILGNDFGISNANDAFIITASGTTIFQFNTQSGGQALKAGGGSWGVLSDARAKHDVHPLTGALERLLKLRGKTYFYNDPRAAGAGVGSHTGFVAQEVEPFFPEWIGQSGGMKTLNISGFEALTVESLRELRAEKDDEIARLRAESHSRLAEKQREIDELRARLDRLEQRLR